MAEVDISKIWSRSKEIAGHTELDNLNEIIKGKSKDTLGWIKLILSIELALNVLMAPLIYLWWDRIGLNWEFYVLLGIICVYVIYYLFLIGAISRFDYAGRIKDSLKTIYRYLSFYLLHYKVVIWVIFPLSFCYGLYIGITDDGKSLSEVSSQAWLTIGVIAILLNGAMIALFTWLINLIYGRKIRRLKAMVDDLSAEVAV